MKILFEKKYLRIPVNGSLPEQFLLFYGDGKLLYDLKVRIDTGNAPTMTAYVNVERFRGLTLDVIADPETDLTKEAAVPADAPETAAAALPLSQSDTVDADGLFSEPYRPLIHFSVPVGHNNDPNGLVYYQGKYHLFCQHNPVEPHWGNMHWYHSVSTDLIHWEPGEDVLFPDENGMAYSGCGLVDERCLTGLGTPEHPAMLLFYTAAAGRTRLAPVRYADQRLAWSADGKTFTKYEGNPIIPHIAGNNRDPKVVWAEEIGKYVMALFLENKTYMLLSSKDLLHWEPLCEYAIGEAEECPDIFPLFCGNTKYWVLTGANDLYRLMHFGEDGKPVFDTEALVLTYSPVTYATQSYAGLPDGRVVRVAWDRLGIKGGRISNQMGIPVEMRLESTADGPRLCEEPVREFTCLRRTGTRLSDVTADGTRRFPVCHPAEVRLTADGVADALVTLSLGGFTAELDFRNNTLTADCPRRVTMPLSRERGKLDLRLIADTRSVEIFADGGRFPLTAALPADFAGTELTLSSDRPVCFREIALYGLESIYR